MDVPRTVEDLSDVFSRVFVVVVVVVVELSPIELSKLTSDDFISVRLYSESSFFSKGDFTMQEDVVVLRSSRRFGVRDETFR